MGRYVPMTRFAYIITFLLLNGCSSSSANLTPTGKVDDEYWMFYQRSEVKIPFGDNISVPDRFAIYEERVNLILESDPITSFCKVIIGSVNFGEPGSGGVAKVLCTNALPLVKDGLFNKNGSPSLRYYLKRVSGT